MSAQNEAQVQMSVTVDEEIARVVEHLESQKTHLAIAHIANQVYRSLDEQHVSPHVIQYLSLQEIKQRARAYLRRRHDPEARVFEAVDSGQADLFGETLQSYYPVERDVMGEVQNLYVPREELESAEVARIAMRLAKAGGALIRHSDALLAWDKSR